MNRRELLKFLGIGAATALVAPKALLTPDDAEFEQAARRYWPGWSQSSTRMGGTERATVFSKDTIVRLQFNAREFPPSGYDHYVAQWSPSFDGPYTDVRKFFVQRNEVVEWSAPIDGWHRIVARSTEYADDRDATLYLPRLG